MVDETRTSRPPGPNLPHSRACGIMPHPHGKSCSSNCPVCGGVPFTAQALNAYLIQSDQGHFLSRPAPPSMRPTPSGAKEPAGFSDEEIATLKELAQRQSIVEVPQMTISILTPPNLTTPTPTPYPGMDLIAHERQRQIDREGYRTPNDAAISTENPDMLARAAACYALPANEREDLVTRVWPWQPYTWKPTPGDRIRELAKAGALIAAEIDRLIYTEETHDV